MFKHIRLREMACSVLEDSGDVGKKESECGKVSFSSNMFYFWFYLSFSHSTCGLAGEGEVAG